MGVNKIEYCGNTLIDLTEDTATAANVLKDKKFHLKNGEAATGSMTNRGAVTATIDEQNGVYTIPKGYHNGNGTVTATYSGSHVASGTYTGTNSTKSFTISGLDFKPTGVVVAMLVLPSSKSMITVSSVPAVSSSGSNIYATRFNTSGTYQQLTGYPITFNNDGFTVSRTSDYFAGTFVYVCWS